MKKILLMMIIFFSPLISHGAELLIISDESSVRVGEELSIVVGISPEGSLINAAEGSITFDPQLLSVNTISLKNSIFSIWTKEPTFNNVTGQIDFAGGTPNAFNGGWGSPLMEISFVAKAEGIVRLDFLNTDILAADGLGTSVEHKVTGLSVSINSAARSITNQQDTNLVPNRFESEDAKFAPGTSANDFNLTFLGFILGSVVLVLVLSLLITHFGVVSGKVQKWVEMFSLIFGLLSIFFFELSIVPALAIALGLTTLRYRGNKVYGMVGFALGVVYLIVWFGHTFII